MKRNSEEQVHEGTYNVPVPVIEEDPDTITSVGRSAIDEEVEALGLGLDPEAAAAARNSRRPDISWLKDAIAKGPDGEPVPLFDVGDRIVIERRATGVLEYGMWLDTQTYTVDGIDDATGLLRLWNKELTQHAYGNYVTGPAAGDVYKLAPSGRYNFGKKKRGRPRKHRPSDETPVTPLPPGEKKRRGRPKGSKNRSREEIVAEKAEKSTVARARRMKREGKR